ncbi:hypothetical protein F5ESL0225_04185 [Lactobacillus sp. ESL0225]|nr:hypothetical protein F5ESL0225_04185 [Lactobacillus sp. ESL0225]
MNKIYEFKKSKDNWTIKTKIDLRPKIIIKTVIISLIIAMVIENHKYNYKKTFKNKKVFLTWVLWRN